MNATITTPTQPSTGPATGRPPSQSPGRQLATLSLALLRSFFRDRVALLSVVDCVAVEPPVSR